MPPPLKNWGQNKTKQNHKKKKKKERKKEKDEEEECWMHKLILGIVGPIHAYPQKGHKTPHHLNNNIM